MYRRLTTLFLVSFIATIALPSASPSSAIAGPAVYPSFTAPSQAEPLGEPSDFAFSTYVGGAGDDTIKVMLVAEDGTTYITGETESSGFPVRHGPGGGTTEGGHAYAMAFDSSGTVKYATLLSPSGGMQVKHAVFDGAGNLYVVGSTHSSGFKTTPGCFQSTYAGVGDLAAVKLDSAGRVRYSTFLGGSQRDAVQTIFVDGQGRLIIAGETESANFPLYRAFQRRFGNQNSGSNDIDGFVTKLNSSGGAVYSTFIGGNGTDRLSYAEPAPDGSVYLAGATGASNFRTRNAAQPRSAGGEECWVTRLGPNGKVSFSTYFGGTNGEDVAAIRVDGDGNCVLYGESRSPELPVVNAFQPSAPEGGAFVAKFDTTGRLVFATWLAGSEPIHSLAIDPANNIYAVGGVYERRGASYPLLNAFDSTLGSFETDVCVAKFSPDGTCVYSTLLGGDSGDGAGPAVVDGSGNLYLVGGTSSTDLPVVNAFQSEPGFRGGMFVAKLDAGGQPVYVTYLDGTQPDYLKEMRVDETGGVVVAGLTSSVDFRTKNAILQHGPAGSLDVVVTRFDSDGVVAFSTYVGTSENDGESEFQLAVSPGGGVCVSGSTDGVDFPSFIRTPTLNCEGRNGFIAIFDRSGNPLLATCFGGNGYDNVTASATNRAGDLRFYGDTTSATLPLAFPWQSSYGGGYDQYLAGFRF